MTFPFFYAFFAFLRIFSFFFVFLRFSPKGQGRTTAIYCKNGEFHSDPVCTDPVQKLPEKRALFETPFKLDRVSFSTPENRKLRLQNSAGRRCTQLGESGPEKGVIANGALFVRGISRISKFSRISSDYPLFSRVWGFSRTSRTSKFSRISRKWTFLKRPLFQKTPFSEPERMCSIFGECLPNSQP